MRDTRRDPRIDLLRFIGLAMIILAHVGPPGALFQARNFDVVLMVMVAGLSFRAAYRQEPYAVYLWKRVKRLVLPVWLFLSAYFLFLAAFGYPMALPDRATILSSYALLEGIGYVWIIRVFLLVALVSPPLLRFSDATASHARYFLVAAAAYVAYEAAYALLRPWLDGAAGAWVNDTLMYLLPYAAVFALGLRLPALSPRQAGWIAAGALAAFLALLLLLRIDTGRVVLTQAYKYPPRLYYLSYGVLASVVLWLAADPLRAGLARLHLQAPVDFIARNSIWVYLWHIPFVEVFHLPYFVKYPVVFAVAACVTWLQVRAIEALLVPPAVKKNLRALLTG